jgi:hypothetical protein
MLHGQSVLTSLASKKGQKNVQMGNTGMLI